MDEKQEEKKESKPSMALLELKRQTDNNIFFYQKILNKFDELTDKMESNLWIMRLIVVALFLIALSQCVKIG